MTTKGMLRKLGNVCGIRRGMSVSTEYDSYIISARRLSMDVNDYCEVVLGWGSKKDDVFKNVCVHCRKDETELLEIGAGTGGYSRYLVDQVSRLHLTDRNDGFVNFLQNYFKKYNHIDFIHNSVNKFPYIKDHSIDIVFGGGVFIYLRLYQIAEYFMEAARILKVDGLLIFNYFDVSCDTDVDKFCMVVSEQRNTWAEVYKEALLKEIGRCFGFEHYVSNVSKRSNELKNMFITFRLQQKR